MKIEDVSAAMHERGPLRRADREVWREEVPPEDTAPSVEHDVPDPTQWGRTQEESRDLLRKQICPVCGEGPWQSPLNHAARKHGILKADLREACGLNSVESLIDPGLRDKLATVHRGIAKGRDMSALAKIPRRTYRMTSAGSAAVGENARNVSDDIRRANARKSKTPEAQAKRSATFRARRKNNLGEK